MQKITKYKRSYNLRLIQNQDHKSQKMQMNKTNICVFSIRVSLMTNYFLFYN